MKALLTTFITIVTLAWGWDAYYANPMQSGDMLWIIRQQGMLLTGLWSVSLMSLVMLLATRPAWLERPLGGMDKMYRLHKWAGILSIAFAAAHWLIKLSKSPISAMIGKAGRVPKGELSFWAELGRPYAKDLAEWTIYLLLVMLVITLWKRFPYKAWRLLHKAMPVAYLVLVFHAVVLTPAAYWQQPIGWLMAGLMLIGSLATIPVLRGTIGKPRQTQGTVLAVQPQSGGITEVHCQLEKSWSGHHAGQFAFVTFDKKEGAHPFTIASADQNNGQLTFQIKALGDYTNRLSNTLKPGQSLTLEGPYGCFNRSRHDRNARQVWIAGGIGITPFLAWLEALQTQPDAAVADLHYCVRDAANDPFVQRLSSLCAALPKVRLFVYDGQHQQQLTAKQLVTETDHQLAMEIWFCGPSGLANSLQASLKALQPKHKAVFHQEAFEMR